MKRGDLGVAREFFELFKTPWEPATPGRTYAALLTTVETDTRPYGADVVIAYGSDVRAGDAHTATLRPGDAAEVLWDGNRIPIYGSVLTVEGVSRIDASCAGRSVDWERWNNGQLVHRVGYDLLAEVRQLITVGQPAAWALCPTLEMHIAMLRSLLVHAGASFVEVPPRPQGYDFACCLTHDLDFFGIRRHSHDLTLLGFVYRGTVGTLIDLVRGRRSWREALKNWAAVVTLPLVFAGLRRDFWHPIDDYAGIELPEHSTFFVVPFRGRPGVSPDGAVVRLRAVGYQASDVADDLPRARARGSEIALHGLDAWRDSSAAALERREVAAAAGEMPCGVRMHWLYFDQDSPARLEDAGFTYDSTWGYNDAVGYRAGTAQAFQLPGTRSLIELPMAIMDSALLFPDRMNLTSGAALKLSETIVGHATRFGGVLVINWHDRSLAPERLWNESYRLLLRQVNRGNRVWFATAGQAVAWYRWRRSIRFTRQPNSAAVIVTAGECDPSLPAAVLKRYDATTETVSLAEERFDGRTVARALVRPELTATPAWQSRAN